MSLQTCPGRETHRIRRQLRGREDLVLETREFGELLIDLEEDKAARAVVFGLLAEMERK
jgi:hypothetical protein